MPRKKIMIDGYNLQLEAGTGIATYARNLSYSLRDLGCEIDVLYGTRSVPKQKLLREIAFFDPHMGGSSRFRELIKEGREFASASFGLEARHVPITGQVIASTYRSRMPHFDTIWNFPNLFRTAHNYFDAWKSRVTVTLPTPPHIAHWTYPLPLKIAGAKNIYTLHDLVPLRLPYTTLDHKPRYFRLVKMLAEQADHIVTVSENSKKDIVELLGVPEERVTNTYQAVEIPEIYANKSDELVQREVEGTFKLTYKGYMLFFGAIEPKKNIGRLIESYLGSGVETPLVIVGKLAWKSQQEMRLLDEKSTELTHDRIKHLDYLPLEMLVSLIKGAKAVLFPSLYEGFGLPVLEAMLLGTPVVTSSEGSTPEIVGTDAALLVDPYDSRAIAEAIRTIDDNAELRAELSEKGRAQAMKFSPAAYQRRLADLYDRLS